jgi:hypothetical protein
MMTYTETIDLREKLEKGEISPDEAKKIYFADVHTRGTVYKVTEIIKMKIFTGCT